MLNRDQAPKNPRIHHEDEVFSDDDLLRTIDYIVGGEGTISVAEGYAILQAMTDQESRLTEEYLDGLNRYYDLENGQKEFYDVVSDTAGFPEANEQVAVVPMTPVNMQWYLHSHLDAPHAGRAGYSPLNNEFKFFTRQPYDIRRFPEGLGLADLALSQIALSPVRLRLHAAFPGLSQTLSDYGANNGAGKSKGMDEFYRGLVQEDEESKRMMALFAMADSLMQRLVRPNDNAYHIAIVHRALQTGDDQELPKYDDVPFEVDSAISVGHAALWA